MHAAQARERLAAILRHVQCQTHHVDLVFVRRVDGDLTEHPAVGATQPEHVVVQLGGPAPVRAAIVGAVHGRTANHRTGRATVCVGVVLFGFPGGLVAVDERVDDVGVRPRDVETDTAAELRLGQPVVEGLPGRTAVGRLVNRRTVIVRLVARVVPRLANPLPGRGVERIRLGGMHDEIDYTGALVTIEDLLPGLAAVGGLVDTAIGVVRPFVPGGSHIDDVGVGRVDLDTGNRVRVGQPHVLPGVTTVDRLVDPRARHRRTENVGLACAHPDDVLVGRRQGDVTDRGRSGLLEDRLPAHALVLAPPHAARGAGHVDRVVVPLRGHDGDIRHAAGDVRRSHELPRQVAEARHVGVRHVVGIPDQPLGGGRLVALLLRGKRAARTKQQGQGQYQTQDGSHTIAHRGTSGKKADRREGFSHVNERDARRQRAPSGQPAGRTRRWTEGPLGGPLRGGGASQNLRGERPQRLDVVARIVMADIVERDEHDLSAASLHLFDGPRHGAERDEFVGATVDDPQREARQPLPPAETVAGDKVREWRQSWIVGILGTAATAIPAAKQSG